MTQEKMVPHFAASALAPWLGHQLGALLRQRGQAWLLQGPSGLGQYSLALALAAAWLCERPSEAGACGECDSCHAVQVRTHPDLKMLLPETMALSLGWPLDEKSQADIDDKKRKPSREIRIDALREAIEFSQRSASRSGVKVMVLYPAEDMNHISANALLKTLEEPAADVRFVLASEAAHRLLPTVRSRCQVHTMHWPAADQALDWLQRQGLEATQAQVLWRASGARPEDALWLAKDGVSAAWWSRLPQALAHNEPEVLNFLAQWPMGRVVSCLQKVCHDLMITSVGGVPRFFAVHELPSKVRFAALQRWSVQLKQAAQGAEHPFHAGLMFDNLISQFQLVLHSHTS